MDKDSRSLLADQLLVQSILGDLDSPANGELLLMCEQFRRTTAGLSLDAGGSEEQFQLDVGQRLLSVCGLQERRTVLESYERLNEQVQQKTAELQGQMSKARQTIDTASSQRTKMEEQIAHFRNKINEQHQLCKEFEKKLAALGFHTAITDQAIDLLRVENEQLHDQCKQLEKELTLYQMSEFSNEELAGRIDELKFELLNYEGFFETSQSEF